MIPKSEVLELRNEWQLRADVVEKDYVLGLVLAGIAEEPSLAQTWIFKGGTALRKCYYETYRLSEDLDFTIIDGGPEDPADLVSIFEGIGQRLYERYGLELILENDSFQRRRNRRGNATTEGRLAFRGPLQPPYPPKVKLDLTSDEVVVQTPELRRVHHPYTDDPREGLGPVRCYPIAELLAEKVRALVERCRPRDLYDVVTAYRHADLAGSSRAVRTILATKCDFAGVSPPGFTDIAESVHRMELESEWENMLAHQLPHLPPFKEFWTNLPGLFDWLEGRQRVAVLPRAELARDALDPAWTAPRMMTSWRRRGAPLELVRFAGANRLKVELDYVPKQGRIGPRLVEPLSLRMTQSGNLLLYLINDNAQLRSYRVDRIRGARVTNEPFTPRYRIEF